MYDIEPLLYTENPAGANICLADMQTVLPVLTDIAPRVIVEIGTYLGGSARLWSKLFSPKVLITIDEKKRTELDLPNTHYLFDNASQHPDTFAKVKRILGRRKIDLLFIDGGHLYNMVKADFEIYSPLVRAGGVVIFHDIYNNNPGNVEVPRYWNELKEKYKYIESSPDNNSSGIGIVYV